MANPKNNPAIHYEFDQRPDAGDTMQVAPGVRWLRMPLPFALGHINLWLLEDGDGWTIIDTGVNVDESKDVWDKTFLEAMDGKPVNRIIVTHLHPDHVGCAGMLCERTESELWMTREEYLMCRVLVADTGRIAPDAGNDFYSAAGFAKDALHHYQKMFGFFGKFVSHIPESYQRMQAGDEITIGKNVWKILIGRGHSPEHACLYCEEQNLFDFRRPVAANYFIERQRLPDRAECQSIARLDDLTGGTKNVIDKDVLVFPAHGKPFRGAHERLDALISEHETGLAELYDWCSEPKRALDAFPVLFKREINDGNLIMATGEAIAHLNYLLHQGRVSVEVDDDGVKWYQQSWMAKGLDENS